MKMVEQSRVSPSPGSVPESSSLPLTFFDLMFLDLPQVQRCFFYHLPYSTSHLIQSHIPTLKSSLSVALQRFYPLAGRFIPSPHSDQHSELRYTQGDSVPFTVFESEDDFLALTGSHLRELSRLQVLVPQITDFDDDDAAAGKSLLVVQITLFPNHGVCIGVSLRHVVCDGFSFIHFVKSWAAAYRSDSSSVPLPSFDRTALVSRHDFFSFFVNLRQSFKSYLLRQRASSTHRPTASLSTETTEFVSATVKLGSEHIQRLKQLVQASSFHTSTFVVTCAYLWVSSVKLQGIATDQMVRFPVVVDWRQRLQPPVPDMYFGNCILFPIVVVKAGDMMKDDGLVVASEAIGKAIDELRQGIGKYFEDEKDKPIEAWMKKTVVTIAGSPRLRVYETDFGWGRPIKVEMVSIKNERVSLAESREEPGGIEIGLVLPKKEMEEFIAIFNEGLLDLL